jgi:hypothetical protein
MVDANAVRELLVANVEGTAKWRRQKANLASGDRRNVQAATRLLALGASLRSRRCGRLLNQLARICAEADDRRLLKFSEIETDLLREIGFSADISNATDYLNRLIGCFTRVAATSPMHDRSRPMTSRRAMPERSSHVRVIP